MDNRIPLDAEVVHNYIQRYINMPMFQKLKFDNQSAEASLRRAFYAHHNKGLNASELVAKLVKQYPTVFIDGRDYANSLKQIS